MRYLLAFLALLFVSPVMAEEKTFPGVTHESVVDFIKNKHFLELRRRSCKENLYGTSSCEYREENAKFEIEFDQKDRILKIMVVVSDFSKKPNTDYMMKKAVSTAILSLGPPRDELEKMAKYLDSLISQKPVLPQSDYARISLKFDENFVVFVIRPKT